MPSGVKRTHKEFVEMFNQNNPNHKTIRILGKYIKNTLPIACKCLVCGYEWETTPKSLLRGCGCPKCSNNVKLTHDEFLDRFVKENSNYSSIEILSKFESMSGKIKCLCKKCETIWSARAGDLLHKNSGCPSCSGNIVFTHGRFCDEFKKKNTNASAIQILSEYKGMKERIKCQCEICKHIWKPIASSLMQGSGCPECAKKRIATIAGEQLKKIERPGIISHNAFLQRFNKSNPHADDIEICSEYRGAHNSVSCKCKICRLEWETSASGLLQGTGCPNCSHTSTSFMEQFLLHAFATTLGYENVLHRNKDVIGKEIDIYLPKFSWAIEIGSWKWHKKIFEKDLEKIEKCKEKDIKLIIIYDSCLNNIQCDDIWTYNFDLGSEKDNKTLKQIVKKCFDELGVLCSITEQQWNDIGVKAYKDSRRVTHEEFLKKLEINNKHFADLILHSEYKYAKDKILCECRKCGHKWKTAASELIKGTGCPVCQIKKVGENKSKKAQIIRWRNENPTGTKLQCEKETGISRVTVYKWWDA